jgi:predicted  nucleic acid-binding Zn-ribbon protein
MSEHEPINTPNWIDALKEDNTSLRQQLAESQALFSDAVQKLAAASRKRKELQAREKMLRDALGGVFDERNLYPHLRTLADTALAMPYDSTALDVAIKQGQKEILLVAASRIKNNCYAPFELRQMADEL